MCSFVQLLFADFIYQNKRLSQDNMIFNSPNKKKKKEEKEIKHYWHVFIQLLVFLACRLVMMSI